MPGDRGTPKPDQQAWALFSHLFFMRGAEETTLRWVTLHSALQQCGKRSAVLPFIGKSTEQGCQERVGPQPPPFALQKSRQAKISDVHGGLSPCRLAKKKKTGKKKKAKPEEPVNTPVPAVPETSTQQSSGDSDVNGLSDRGDVQRDDDPTAPAGEPSPGGQEEGHERSALSQLALRIPEMKDTSMESVGQPLSKVMDRLNGQLDPGGWSAPLEPPRQSFRTGTPGETPDGSSSGDFSEGISAPMDFYRFTVESPNAAAPGGGHHDAAGAGQPPHVSGSPETPKEEEESREGEAVGAVEESGGVSSEPQTAQMETINPEAVGEPKKEQPSPSLSSAEDSGVEEGQGSPSELTHPSEFR